MKMNVKLLRKVQKHILAEPKRFLMRYLVVRRNGRAACVIGNKFIADNSNEMVPFARCGTAACIAGWSCLLAEPDRKTRHFWERGLYLLGISNAEGYRLFIDDEWPEEFAYRYEAASSQEERVKIASERIDHFIATKGKE